MPQASNKSCDFCHIIQNNPNTIFENDQFAVLLDIAPISLGHAMICPKKHFTDFHEVSNEFIGEMMSLAKRYILLLQKLFPAKGYSMMLNGGAFNDLAHCHVHVFPRNSKEEFQWTYDERMLSTDATRFSVLKNIIEGYI